MANYQFPDAQILLFAKAPIAGQVKTRLQPQLNPQQSAELHRQLLEYMLEGLQYWAIAPVTLMTAGRHDCWLEYEKRFGVTLKNQSGGDLGQRMASSAEPALRQHTPVILLGSDCPFITESYLQGAFKFLRRGVDVVFGPADDGGYVLLGLNEMKTSLFADIAWGAETVLQQSCENLQEGYVCLPSLRDIDRPDDIPALAELPPFKHWLCCAP